MLIVSLYSLFVAGNLVLLSLISQSGAATQLLPAAFWLAFDAFVTAIGVVAMHVASYRDVFMRLVMADAVALAIAVAFLWVGRDGHALARVFLGGLAAIGAAKVLEICARDAGLSRGACETLNAICTILILGFLIYATATLPPALPAADEAHALTGLIPLPL